MPSIICVVRRVEGSDMIHLKLIFSVNFIFMEM